MHRIFVEKTDDIIKVKGDDFNHMKRSLRMNIKDLFEVSDEKNCFTYIIDKIEDDCLIAIKKEENENKEKDLEVVLYQGIAKGDKMDLIIQKATELGVSKIVPIQMDRSIAKIDKKDKKKIDRFNKIALSAASQSRRLKVPKVVEPIKISEIEEEKLLVCYEGEKTINLKEVLKTSVAKRISFLIGPEGGISEGEIEVLRDKNAVFVSLGPRILRCETAPLAMMSIIQYELGDIGNEI